MASPFPDSLWAEIRKEYGEHCVRRRDYRKANKNFEESLQLRPNKLDSVYLLTNSQAREANLDEALKLLRVKAKLAEFKHHFNSNLQECDCNYENNLFERSLLLVTEKAQRIQNEIVNIPHTTEQQKIKQKEAKLKGPKLDPLHKRFEMIRTNFDDMIGKNAGNCLFEQRRYFDKIKDSWKQTDSDKTQNLSRSEKLTNTDECDVVSVQEKNVREISVKESHRLKKLKQKFAQCYMQSAWKDFEFINGLKTNRILIESKQNKKSFDVINREIDDCVETTAKMIQQLHARCPLYTYNTRMFPDQTFKQTANKISRFHMQYRTCRDIFLALEEIHKLRASGKLEKLIKTAEHELGVHYQIKSDKLMPRKKEFTAEICDLIGLAHLDRLQFSQNKKSMSGLEQLAAIFEVSITSKKLGVPYVFGNQRTYRDPAKPDTSYLGFKRNVNRLEGLLKQARLPIEKCHLYHEMGKANLVQNNYEEARSFARRVIEEAVAAENVLWKFLAQILICRAFLKQKNIIETFDCLKVANSFVDVFKNPKLSDVIAECVKISEGLSK